MSDLPTAARWPVRAACAASFVLARLAGGPQRQQVLFAGPGLIDGVIFAPDGSRIGFGWPAADAWLFAQPVEQVKQVKTIDAAPEISSYFVARLSSAAGPPAGFPRVVGWCC